MASPPIPPQLDHLITRPFSFYPPIIGIEHNEWLYRKASWSEILVVNCKSGAEIWLSRRYIGEVSRVDDPVLIVGLKSELEYKGGMVVPFQRRAIEMPLAVGGNAGAARPGPGAAPARRGVEERIGGQGRNGGAAPAARDRDAAGGGRQRGAGRQGTAGARADRRHSHGIAAGQAHL